MSKDLFSFVVCAQVPQAAVVYVCNITKCGALFLPYQFDMGLTE